MTPIQSNMEQGEHFEGLSPCNLSLVANGSGPGISLLMACRFNLTLHHLNPFNDPLTRIFFIIICVLIFLTCVFGNMAVLLVTARNLRMQTRTNLLLANLAVADLCVGIFCVIPNMFNYLFLEWYLGQIMCKLYQFIESVNFTASMLLLEVIAIERYIAINHPLKAKRLFTRKKMFLAQFTVWFVSSVYNIPFLFIYDTIESHEDNVTGTFCYSNTNFQVEFYYIVTFVLWYLIPLFIMSTMYATIANTLWKSSLPLQMRPWNGSRANVSRTNSSQSGGTEAQARRSPISIRSVGLSQSCNLTDASMVGSWSSDMTCSSTKGNQSEQGTPVKINKVYKVLFKKQRKASGQTIESIYFRPHFKIENGTGSNKEINGRRSPCSMDLKVPCLLPPNSDNDQIFALSRDNSLKREASLRDYFTKSYKANFIDEDFTHTVNNQTQALKQSSYPHNINRMTLQRNSRRRVVKLLIVVLFTFAVLVLPNHVRLLLIYFHPFDIYWASWTGPICHILMYMNSAVNPILYSLFSESFRRSLRELIYCCRSRRPRV